MGKPVIQRPEMLEAVLDLGGRPIRLADYAGTGLMAVAVGPRGNGKTNLGLLMAEQLSTQGWVSVLIDPEMELEGMYGAAVSSPEDLALRLKARAEPILVVNAPDASSFVPYARAIMAVADDDRKPIFVVIDEGQVFSSPKSRKGDVGEASDLINDLVGRGRKRAVDLFITALRYTGTLHRSVFGNANLRFVGCLEDSTGWAALAPQFRAVGLEFGDLHTLAPAEFFVISRTGIEKVATRMATKLKEAAPRAPSVKRVLPQTFRQWDSAMAGIPDDRLARLTGPVVSLMGAVAGLSPTQMEAGARALEDELEGRA